MIQPIVTTIKLADSQRESHDKWRMTYKGDTKIVMSNFVQFHSLTFEEATTCFVKEECDSVQIKLESENAQYSKFR